MFPPYNIATFTNDVVLPSLQSPPAVIATTHPTQSFINFTEQLANQQAMSSRSEITKSEPTNSYYNSIGHSLTLLRQPFSPLTFVGVVDRANDILNIKGVDACYNFIYKETDFAFQLGNFAQVNSEFLRLDIGKTSIDALLAFFTITKHAKDRLPNRVSVFEQFQKRVISERPDLVKRTYRIR